VKAIFLHLIWKKSYLSCKPCLNFYLTPIESTGIALRLVDADHRAAPGARPLFFFIPDELPYAGLLYLPVIIDHDHAIFPPVALIQVIESCARELIAFKTKSRIVLLYIFTGLYPAIDAGLRLAVVVGAAARTGIFLPHIGLA